MSLPPVCGHPMCPTLPCTTSPPSATVSPHPTAQPLTLLLQGTLLRKHGKGTEKVNSRGLRVCHRPVATLVAPPPHPPPAVEVQACPCFLCRAVWMCRCLRGVLFVSRCAVLFPDVLPVVQDLGGGGGGGRRRGAVTCFCVSPGVGSGCRVVFSPPPPPWVGVGGVTHLRASPHGAQHPSGCLAGTAWGWGAQAWEILGTNPSHRWGLRMR